MVYGGHQNKGPLEVGVPAGKAKNQVEGFQVVMMIHPYPSYHHYQYPSFFSESKQ